MATSPSGTMETKVNLTKQKLLELIQEQLMLELFDNDGEHYKFIKKEPIYKIVDEEDGIEDMFYDDEEPEREMVMMYHFIADKDPDNRLRYDVEIKCSSDEQEFQIDFKANETWKLTNQMDLKVYTTIAAIVKDFAENVRPTLYEPFNEITSFGAQAAAEFKGDERRMRIYKYLLMKKANIKADSYTFNKNRIYWEIPI